MNKIALLSESFISETLLETLIAQRIPTCAPITLDERLQCISLNSVKDLLLKKENLLVYTNAEEWLPLLMEPGSCSEQTKAIRLCKDKVQLRSMLKGIEPPIYFKELPQEEMGGFRPPSGMDLVIKPAVGFLSLGVRHIRSNWIQMVKEAQDELKRTEGMFPPGVLKGERFLLEEYIEGDEYACDGYFDGRGDPVILSVSQHMFENDEDTRDLLYYSSADMVEELAPRAADLLRSLSSRIPLRHFPFHLEFRLRDSRLQVIELNPMRFGGFGLADLAYFAFGTNSYDCFFRQKKPDLRALLPHQRRHYYAFVLGRVPKESTGQEPDHRAFRASFEKVLDYSPIDHHKYPFFCRVLAESDRLENFTGYLKMDFSRFFTQGAPHNPE